jgi:hypothetical protein
MNEVKRLAILGVTALAFSAIGNNAQAGLIDTSTVLVESDMHFRWLDLTKNQELVDANADYART